MKQFLRTLHLWTGLVFGAILVVLGLTGSLLSWIHELDSMLNPGLLQVAPPANMRAGDPFKVDAALVQAATDTLVANPAYGRPSMLELPERAGDVFVAWYRPAPAAGAAPWSQAVTRQVMVDPARLVVLGERNWGEAGLSRPLLMPTLFHIHRYLVAGEVGKVVIAVTGVSLLLMTITGIILWWPKMAKAAIWKAITVRHGGSWPRFSFQLHRAGGFFAAPVLLVTALSGVYFNMPAWVTPAIKAVSHVSPNGKLTNKSEAGSRVSAAEAVAAAQAEFPNGRVSRLSFPAKPDQPFEARVRQPGELRMGPGATRISIDSGNGAVLRVIDPVRATGGDKFISWLFPLHTGEAFGTAGRVFISLFGLVPLAFFVTGLVVWLKLRRPAKAPRRKQAAAVAA
ncbi:PepSY-associated TM helix domain-containing protein [Massilia sp. GCM10020059]|uniref:PepSY domain-containing protein n=1 Tax=Massilia agrisoli TaxID=2892444 RepID=A0ABS8IWE2_9BURK|nr:PepSY-associated TM helix domain-containing protein [Massilia agrisoli]MCC6072939.1 PepSY domain-containing protein [Massilia agrisoli]